MHNGHVEVFLLLKQLIAPPSLFGEIVDASDVHQMRSRVQPEGILIKCNVVVDIGDRAFNEGGCGIIIRTFGLMPVESDLHSRSMVQSVKITNRGLPDSDLKGLKVWKCEGRNTERYTKRLKATGMPTTCPFERQWHEVQRPIFLRKGCCTVDSQTFLPSPFSPSSFPSSTWSHFYLRPLRLPTHPVSSPHPSQVLDKYLNST